MKPSTYILLFLSTIILSACSATPIAGESTQESPCRSATTQAEMNECTNRSTQAEYEKLNSLIIELQGHMDADQYTAFLTIETDWEKVAKDHCEWEAAFFSDGSNQPMRVAECLFLQYHQRIEALRLNLCEGHGMTGECEASLNYK